MEVMFLTYIEELHALIKEMNVELVKVKERLAILEMSYEEWVAFQNSQERVMEEMHDYFEAKGELKV